MSIAEVVLHGFMAWAVINTGLMLLLVAVIAWEGRGRRAGRRTVKAWDGTDVQVGGGTRQPWGGA